MCLWRLLQLIVASAVRRTEELLKTFVAPAATAPFGVQLAPGL